MSIKQYEKKKALKMQLASLIKAVNSIQKSKDFDALVKLSKDNKLHVSIHPDLVNAVKQHLAKNAHPEDPHALRMVAGDCDRPKPDCFDDDTLSG